MNTIGTRPTTQFPSSYSSGMGAASMTSSTTSFTSQLRKTLIESRSIIDIWVSSEKQCIDMYVSNAKQEISMKQKQIDSSSTQLLALQLQHGCSMNENNTNNLSNSDPSTTKNGLSELQIALENKIQQQTKINQRLETQLESLKKQIEGMCISNTTSIRKKKKKDQNLLHLSRCFVIFPT
jgi:beta-glucosidase-like glycosyl hydrolase